MVRRFHISLPMFFTFFYMSFYKSLLLFCFCIPMVLMAQRSDDNQIIMSDLYPGEAVETFDLRERKMVGQSFFNENWLFGHFVFDDGSLSKGDYLLKYDLLNQELIVNLNGSVYVVPTENISGFILKNNIQTTVKLPEYVFVFSKLKGLPGRTILEKVIEGEFGLYILHHVTQLKPNYVPALDAGNLNTKIVKKNKCFLWTKGKFLEIPTRKKQAVKFFGKYATARQYMKEHKMKAKSEEYLIALINSMNQ